VSSRLLVHGRPVERKTRVARATDLPWEVLKLHGEVRTTTDLLRIRAFPPLMSFAKWRFRFLTFTLACPPALSS
jgi:hypothetical protein